MRSEGVERCSRVEWSRLKRDRKRNRQDERRQRQVPRDREWLGTPCAGGSFNVQNAEVCPREVQSNSKSRGRPRWMRERVDAVKTWSVDANGQPCG